MRLRRIASWTAAIAIVPALLLAAPATGVASAATGTGWIRLAHLSPNTPAVDVYLYSFGDSSAQLVLHHVAYGDVSPYESLAPGDYSVAMRAAGASASTKPVLSTSVTVSAGHAYTVAGLGPESALRLQVLDDKLSTPKGDALVRVIQASLKQHVVTVTEGQQTLSSDLSFGEVSSYQAVPATDASVQVTGSSENTEANVDLAAGSVHTLVVLDGGKGLMIDNLLDAAGSGTAPSGGAATGLGGMAPRAPSSPLPWLVLIGAGAVLVLGSSIRLRRLRL
jgi:hypothetical protein